MLMILLMEEILHQLVGVLGLVNSYDTVDGRNPAPVGR